MSYKLSDSDREAQIHESIQALHESHKALHEKVDQMVGHLATIAGAVQKAPEGNAPSQSSPADKSG